MKKSFKREALNYGIYGVLFGCCFPLIATAIEVNETFGSLSWAYFWSAQAQSPLLWIIDTAPFFLGLFAYVIGQQIDRINAKNLEAQHVREQLTLHNQMAMMGKQIAGIAHEIKNPLNFVINFSEGSIELMEDLHTLVKEQKGKIEPPAYEELMTLVKDLDQNAHTIKENGERANRIVFSLMDKAREDRHQMIDLHLLLDENVTLAYTGFHADHPHFEVDIQRDYQDKLPDIKVNPHSLGRVMLNLFNNACYALYQKQKLDPSTFNPALLIQTKQLSHQIEIRIRDNGIGIPKVIQEKIFDPFYTTKPIGHGNTGLGLSISREVILQEHQGNLSIVSEPGDFTEFLIYLPV